MITVDSHNNSLEQTPYKGPASPVSVTNSSLNEEDLTVSHKGSPFIEAPQKFFGKYLKINVEDRGLEEKEANRNIRTEFHGNLHAFFGPILAEYLYPQETHEEMLEKGTPLVPSQAEKIVNKGIEMLNTLTEFCKQCLSEEAKPQTQSTLLDQAMIRYAHQQEAVVAKRDSMIDLLPHAARAIGGGAMAIFAVATLGHLTPTDIYFLADLLSSKKLSKSIEDFITARLSEHIKSHLETYIREQENSLNPMSSQEEARLRELLLGETRHFSHESAYPSAKSGAIHTAALVMGMAPIHTPLDAVKVIFQGESFDTGAHNQIFREGVTAVIDSITRIQGAISEANVSSEELLKVKKAIDTASQKISTMRESEVQPQKLFKNQATSGSDKKDVLRPHLKKGI